jgi:hypothetical protein
MVDSRARQTTLAPVSEVSPYHIIKVFFRMVYIIAAIRPRKYILLSIKWEY